MYSIMKSDEKASSHTHFIYLYLCLCVCVCVCVCFVCLYLKSIRHHSRGSTHTHTLSLSLSLFSLSPSLPLSDTPTNTSSKIHNYSHPITLSYHPTFSKYNNMRLQKFINLCKTLCSNVVFKSTHSFSLSGSCSLIIPPSLKLNSPQF